MRRAKGLLAGGVAALVVGGVLVYSLSGGLPGRAQGAGGERPTALQASARMADALERFERARGGAERASALDGAEALAREAVEEAWPGRRSVVLGVVGVLARESHLERAERLVDALARNPERPPDRLACLAARARLADRRATLLSVLSSADAFGRADAAVYAIQRLLDGASREEEARSLNLQMERALARPGR